MADERLQNAMNDRDRTAAVINFVKELADEQNFRATIKGSMVGGVACGATAFAASLLFGPIGLVVGGTAGGLLGYCIAKDTYKPLSVVIDGMSREKKRKLRAHVETMMENLDARDVVALIAIMASDSTLKVKIATSIFGFVAKEMGVTLLR